MLSSLQVETALSSLSAREPSAAAVAQFQAVAPKLWDSLFKSGQFINSNQGIDELNSTVQDKGKNAFYLALSETLCVDSTKVINVFEQQLKAVGVSKGDKVDLQELSLLREAYCSQHASAWMLLHEMLRIDLDPGHVMHAPVSAAVDELMRRNLVQEIIKRLLDVLSEWQPNSMDRTVFSPAGAATHDLSRFLLSTQQAWVLEYIEEYCRCLDTLVLLSYSRRNLDLGELGELLSKFACQPVTIGNSSALQTLLESAMRGDISKVENALQKINFRYLVLFSGCFQFWRSFQGDAELLRQHPLLTPVAPDYQATSSSRDGFSSNNGVNNNTADSILETLQNVTDVLGRCAGVSVKTTATPVLLRRAESGGSERAFGSTALVLAPDAPTPVSLLTPALRAVLVMWLAFLQSFASHSIVGAEFVETEVYRRFFAAVYPLEVMVDVHQIVASGLNGRIGVAQVVGAHASADASLHAPQDLSLLAPDPNAFIYCSVLQELTNILIRLQTLRDDGALTEIGATTALVELTYRGQPDLCGGFWAAWAEEQRAASARSDLNVSFSEGDEPPMDQAYPLCRLVRMLQHSTSHDPVYLYRVLTALACSAPACMSIVEILNQPVFLIQSAHCSQLQYRGDATQTFNSLRSGSYEAIQWDVLKTWMREHDDQILPGTQVKKVSSELTSASSARAGLWARQASEPVDPMVYYGTLRKPSAAQRFARDDTPASVAVTASEPVLCAVPERSLGRVLDFDPSAGQCLVRWDTQCLLWTVAIDALLASSTDANAAGAGASASERAVVLEALMKLLSALLRDAKQASVVAYFLETKWNETALFNLVRGAQCEEFFPHFSQRDVRMSHLRADPAATFDFLTQEMGVGTAAAERIISRLKNPSKSEAPLFTCSFADVLARVSVNALQAALQDAQSAKPTAARSLVTALDLHVTLSAVSPAWSAAVVTQTAAVFPSARGGGLYEALFAATELKSVQPVRPEVFYLMSLFVRRETAQANALPGRSVLRRVSRLFETLDTTRSGYVSVEEISSGLGSRGVDASEEELEAFLQELGIASDAALDYAAFAYLLVGKDVRDSSADSSAPCSAGLGDFRIACFQVAAAMADPTEVAYTQEHTKSAVIFVLNQFTTVYKSTGLLGKSVEEQCFLLLQSLEAIRATLSSSPDLVAFVVECIAGNIGFQESMVHLSLCLALLSVQTRGAACGPRPATFKDLLAVNPIGPSVLESATSAILPLDFSGITGGDGESAGRGLPESVLKALWQASSVALQIVSRMLSVQRDPNGLSFPERRLQESLLSLMTLPCGLSLGGLPWLADLVASSPRPESATAQGSYLALMCGLLSVPTATAESRISVLRTVTKVAELLSIAATGSNLADCIGTDNLPAVVNALESCLLDSQVVTKHRSPCAAALDLLYFLAGHQPGAMCMLLSAKKNASAGSTPGYSPADSALLTAALHVLSQADDLYNSHPHALHVLYELLITICRATEFHALVKTALYMIQTKKFWDFIAVPLMLDVAPAPNVAVQFTEYSEKYLLGATADADQALRCGENAAANWCGTEKNNVSALGADVALHCLRLHCHAAALTLLSIERYGMFYEIDSAVAAATTKKLQAFYVKATESHRFVSWIKHYLVISINSHAQHTMTNFAGSLGVDLDALAVPEASMEYGLKYRCDAERVETSMRNAYRVGVTQDLALSEADRVNIYLLQKFKTIIGQFNLSASLSDAALELIRAWRQFLEFYVLPGSAAKQHQQRERSGSDGGATPAASRGRKHSFDGDHIDDGASSASPQVGTLSSLTSAQSQASPLAGKKSSFAGDKRSYEVVTEIMTQLECHRGDGCMDTALGRTVISEKCELLVSMLHHQLKSVAARTSDPSKSVTVSRDLGSMRLTQDKMEKLLEKMDDFYGDLVYRADGTESTLGSADEDLLLQLKNSIALRLLTSMMLLLNSIFAFNSADDVHSKLSQRRRSVYLYAVTALKNLLHTQGVSVLSNTPASVDGPFETANIESYVEESKGSGGAAGASEPTSKTSNRMTTEQSIAQVCLQILKLALPRSSAVPYISLTDHTAWRTLLADSGATELLTRAVQQVAAITSNLPLWGHNYAGWSAQALQVGAKGAAEAAPVRVVPRPVDAATYEEHRCMTMSLLSALDAIISAVAASVISVHSTRDISALLAVLTNAPVLRCFQQTILSQPEEVAAALMGYNSVTGEPSLVASCWIRVVNLVESIAVRLGDAVAEAAIPSQDPGVGAPTVTALDLETSFCTFIRTYVDLLILPMRPATHRYTVRQLALMRASVNLFTTADAKLPAWKVNLPAIHVEVSRRAMIVMKVFSLLLWHGEDMETLEQQRRLLGHCVMVSSAEKREGRAMQPRKMRRRSGSLGSRPGTRTPDQHVRFGETTVLGASIMKSSGQDASPDSGTTTPLTKGRKPIGYYSSLHSHHAGAASSSGGDLADGLQDSLVEFLLDVEAHMIAVMAPLAAFIRHITPIPLEVASFDEYGRPQFPVGNHVFYISERAGGALLEGVVARLRSSDCFDVVLMDDMVESEVHASQVKYTSAPIIQFQSLSDLAKHSVDDSSTMVTVYHGHPEFSNALSTSHLLRSLQLATSAVTGSRMQNQQLYPQGGQDLCALAGQLAWLVVSNIAHHALAPMGKEISMIHQLNDLKRAIRPRDHAHGAGLSTVSAGSTSPFVSYLDQRDRSHATPVGGALTPTSSFTGAGSTSAYLKWMHTPEWTSYVVFLDKWCEEIFYILGRGTTLVTPEEEVEESPSARIRKKRIGLRARIEWVQSPEEV